MTATVIPFPCTLAPSNPDPDPHYLTCAETAKLVRAALKKAFPGVTFSVRSKTYSGGASIDVGWTDGPEPADVEKVTGIYTGARFDGSIDLKTHTYHWLLPDGTVTLARMIGTEGSGGSIPSVRNGRPAEGAEYLSMGADYIFCTRRKSGE